MRSLFLSILFFSQVTIAGEGGWIGSGGELFKDAHNPWFLRNVSSVSYCIDIASGSISASESEVKTAVQYAIDYWKAELTRASLDQAGHFKLGMQKFVFGACTDATDIRFLFGYETLTAKEIEFLKEPRKYIGVTVRTDYDPVQLRGKGFIFISSDFGPNAYINTGNLIERAWSQPRLLQYALLHELGHVFGLVHTGSGLMSEAFLEQVITKSLSHFFQKLPIPSFFSPAEEMVIESLGMSMVTRAWTGMKPDHNAVVLKKIDDMKIEVYGQRNAPMVPELLGTLQNVPMDAKDYHPTPAIFAHLTDEQKVFTPQETLFRSFMFGPMFKEHGMKTSFVTVSGQVKPGYMRITPTKFMVTASHNGKVEVVLNYASPLGMALMIEPTP